MHAIYRNFISALRFNKTAAILNIMGLAIAYIVFATIYAQVDFANKFDRFHPQVDHIYRVDCKTPASVWSVHSRLLIDAFVSASPYIQKSTLINPFIGECYFTTDVNGNQTGFKETVQTCSPDITGIFDFVFREGTPDCLKQPEMCLIPESLARRIFGSISVAGKQLTAEGNIWTKDRKSLTVGGVYKDFPENSQLANAVYTTVSPSYQYESWDDYTYVCYILVTPGADKKEICSAFARCFNVEDAPDYKEAEVKLTNLADIYYKPVTSQMKFIKSGKKENMNRMLMVAFLVALIAMINYINYSVALIPYRIKSINIRKIAGASVARLRCAQLFESVVISLVACLPAVLLNLSLDIPVLLRLVSLSLAVGLIAGIYPAVSATSISMQMALKGSYGLSPKGLALRKMLIGIQYVISFTLVILAFVIYQQNRYMESRSFGYGKNRIAVVVLNGKTVGKIDLFTNELKKYSGIEDVAFSSAKVGAEELYRGGGAEKNNEMMYFHYLNVSPNFLSVMDIPVMEGRCPRQEDRQSKDLLFVFNRKAKEEYGLEVGDRLITYWKDKGMVIGITDELKINSLRTGAYPLAFVINEKNAGMPVACIKIRQGADMEKATEHIRQTFKEIDPAYPVEIEYYETIIRQLYRDEIRTGRIVSASCLASVLISLSGILGLVLFETQYRRREIAIRKVLGATVKDVLYRFNRTYLMVLIVSFVISVPVSVYFAGEWLKNFAYKVPLDWTVYVVSFFSILLLTVFVVTLQTWRTANENPVNSLSVN